MERKDEGRWIEGMKNRGKKGGGNVNMKERKEGQCKRERKKIEEEKMEKGKVE